MSGLREVVSGSIAQWPLRNERDVAVGRPLA
jgi:hypothetical protein